MWKLKRFLNFISLENSEFFEVKTGFQTEGVRKKRSPPFFLSFFFSLMWQTEENVVLLSPPALFSCGNLPRPRCTDFPGMHRVGRRAATGLSTAAIRTSFVLNLPRFPLEKQLCRQPELPCPSGMELRWQTEKYMVFLPWLLCQQYKKNILSL